MYETFDPANGSPHSEKFREKAIECAFAAAKRDGIAYAVGLHVIYGWVYFDIMSYYRGKFDLARPVFCCANGYIDLC